MTRAPHNTPESAKFRDWLEAACQGDRDALGALLEHYRAYLLLVANRRLPLDLQAKLGPSDIVQETLLRAERGFERFDRFECSTEADLRRWLRRILLNYLAEVQRHYSTSKADVNIELPLPGDLLQSQESSTFDRDDSEVNSRIAALHQALARLTASHRQVIQWRAYERLSFAEIGRRLDCTEAAARMRWVRAIAQLTELLGPPHETG